MMNLEKMKQKKRTITKSRVKKSLLAATTFLCLTTPLLQTQTAYAAENTTPAITIEKPDGWKQGETTIAVTVDASHMPEGFSIAKIEAKAGKDGSWQDVTGSGSITITGNQTVYVRVTDGEGKVYEQNRSIKCYDTEKPTLSASLTDGVLTIQGNDTVSGITAVTVNGTTYTDLKDGMLRVQLTQKDFTTKQIEITVTDGAGNTSEKYVLQNPYYEWAKKQAEKQKTSSNSNGAMATTTSADATGTEKTTTSPLPQDAQASEPTDEAPVKSIGNGTTTPRDLENDLDVWIIQIALAESVAARLRKHGFKCKTVEITVRDNGLYSFSRQIHLRQPTNITNEIVTAAFQLFKDNYKWEHPIRSLGIRAADLVLDDIPVQLDLFGNQEKKEKLEKLDRTVDEIRRRFGYFSIQRAAMYQDKVLSHLDAGTHTIHPHSYFHG